MKIGDIVWVKVREESSGSSYWPGLLQTRDIHGRGVLVSFFNLQSPRYFRSSEIRPFSKNFHQSMPTELDGACQALLDRALRWLCRRTALVLGCRCLSETAAEMVVGDDGEAFDAKNSFRAEAVLGFVLTKAVWPWVEVEDFVGAVGSVAEIQVFRDYNAIGRKSAYRKSRRARRRYEEGAHLELHPSSNSMAEESCNLELDFESQASPKPEKMDVEACVGSKMNLPTIILKESLQPLHEDQLEKRLIWVQKEEEQFLYETLVNLQCLALDSFCLGANCLDTLKQNLLAFRSILYEKSSNMHNKRCSLESTKGYFSQPDCLKTRPSVEANGKKCDGEVSGSIIPYIERPVSRLGCKRRLDLLAFCESPSKFNKRMPVFFITGAGYYLQVNKLNAEVDLSSIFLSYNGIDSFKRNDSSWEETSIHNFFLGSPVKSEIQNCRALISKDACNTDLLDLSHNVSNFHLFKDSVHGSKIIEVSKDQEQKVKDASESFVKLQELDGSISTVKESGTCMYSVCNTPEKTINGFQNDDIKVDNSSHFLQPSATQLSVHDMFGTHDSDVKKVNHDAAIEVSRSEFRLVPDKIQIQPSGDMGAISVESIRKAVSLNVASEDRTEKIQKFDNSSTSTGLLLNGLEAPQSKALHKLDGSKSLHMKFPRDYNLPSKEELVRKFRPFGPIDFLKTRIFNYTGSALVVFFNESDAMAAYQYAKRKKLLPGQPNVRYWLDRFEGKRGGAKLMTVKPLEPGLRPCLRNSNAPGSEDRRKHQKVRFLMETGS